MKELGGHFDWEFLKGINSPALWVCPFSKPTRFPWFSRPGNEESSSQKALGLVGINYNRSEKWGTLKTAAQVS
jgi:hypothetical protein